jgi:hypothetical protein
MTYQLTCLVCRARGPSLVGLQEHVMRVHKYTPKQLRHNTRRDHHQGYIYTMPDGVDLLLAERKLPQAA